MPAHPVPSPVRFAPLQGLGLVFVAAYQKALSLLYVDELLALVKAEFTSSYYKPNVSVLHTPKYRKPQLSSTAVVRQSVGTCSKVEAAQQVRVRPPARTGSKTSHAAMQGWASVSLRGAYGRGGSQQPATGEALLGAGTGPTCPPSPAGISFKPCALLLSFAQVMSYPEFTERFQRIHQECQAKAERAKAASAKDKLASQQANVKVRALHLHPPLRCRSLPSTLADAVFASLSLTMQQQGSYAALILVLLPLGFLCSPLYFTCVHRRVVGRQPQSSPRAVKRSLAPQPAEATGPAAATATRMAQPPQHRQLLMVCIALVSLVL